MGVATSPQIDVRYIIPGKTAVERALWIGAIIALLVGDSGSTLVALELGATEQNPLVRWVLATGIYPIHKGVLIGGYYLVWRHFPSVDGVGPRPYRAIVPVMMIAIGTALTMNNILVILELT